jgi:hypothetical protein
VPYLHSRLGVKIGRAISSRQSGSHAPSHARTDASPSFLVRPSNRLGRAERAPAQQAAPSWTCPLPLCLELCPRRRWPRQAPHVRRHAVGAEAHACRGAAMQHGPVVVSGASQSQTAIGARTAAGPRTAAPGSSHVLCPPPSVTTAPPHPYSRSCSALPSPLSPTTCVFERTIHSRALLHPAPATCADWRCPLPAPRFGEPPSLAPPRAPAPPHGIPGSLGFRPRARHPRSCIPFQLPLGDFPAMPCRHMPGNLPASSSALKSGLAGWVPPQWNGHSFL